MEKIKLNNVVLRETNLEGFFLLWLECLRHLHNLTKTEMVIVAYILTERYKQSLELVDRSTIDNRFRINQVKQGIIERAGITNNTYSVHIQHLKDKGIIKDGKIVPQWIPNIIDNTFMLLTVIKINDSEESNIASI